MRSILEFTKEGNWQKVYEEARIGQRIDDKNYYPIPAFEIGFLFTSHILAIRTLSTKAKSNWRYAGNLYQRLQLGAGGAASSLPTVDLSSKGILLNRSTLIDLPRYTYEFGLVFAPPFWIEDMRVTFWQYVGIDSNDVTDTLAAARDDLARIEMKIDSYSGF